MTTPAKAKAALKDLATALGPGFITVPGTMPDGQPCLTVICRATRTAGDICAGQTGWLWWPWAERIAPAGNPQAAARAVAALLHGATAGGDQR